MYAVVFSAKIKEMNTEYSITARKMRSLAIEKYGCIDFIAATEGDNEIAVSYWPSLEHIQGWKDDPEHMEAQRLGQERWYSEYKVQVTRVEKQYQSHT